MTLRFKKNDDFNVVKSVDRKTVTSNRSAGPNFNFAVKLVTGILFIFMNIAVFAADSPKEEIPFWKARKEIYKRIKEDRYIAVSAKSESVGEEKKLTVQTAGVIHAPVAFVHREVADFSSYAKFVPYMEESAFDKTTQNLFVHGAVLGYHVRMTLHIDQRTVSDGHVIDWKSVSGSYLGMVGQINEKELDAEHTEISLSAHYVGESLGIPPFLLNWGLEYAAQRAAGEMRRHIEADFAGDSKKH